MRNVLAIALLGFGVCAAVQDTNVSTQDADARIERLENLSDHRYMRLVELEQEADRTGDLTRCWDTGGYPGGPCVCPDGSTWLTEEDFRLQGCQWDTDRAVSYDPYDLPVPEDFDSHSRVSDPLPPPDGRPTPVPAVPRGK